MLLYRHSFLGMLIFSSIVASSAHANRLQDILQYSLNSAPEIHEANANIEASRNRTEQAKSEHWPVVRAVGSSTVSQYHRDRSDYQQKRFTPGVKAELNLYSFGAIDKNIERNRKEEEFYQHKYTSTREDLAYTIAQLYLRALNMKESIQVMKKSLARHKAIMGNLGTIVANDMGRQSEYVQAEARMLSVEQNINRYNKELAVTLNTLSKYTKVRITEKDLENPFNGLSDNELFNKYAIRDKAQNPTYKAQQAELEAKQLAVEAENKKELPKVNLVGFATQDDRYVGVEVNWDILNRGNNYGIHEKASEMAAAHQRLDRISRDIEETSQLAQINIRESRIQLKTLKALIASSAKVVNFYKLQFDIARRSLLDVLNAERELSEVELSLTGTEYALRLATLDYLYSQGALSTWGNVQQENKPLKF